MNEVRKKSYRRRSKKNSTKIHRLSERLQNPPPLRGRKRKFVEVDSSIPNDREEDKSYIKRPKSVLSLIVTSISDLKQYYRRGWKGLFKFD